MSYFILKKSVILFLVCVPIAFLFLSMFSVAGAQGIIPCEGSGCNFEKFILLIQNVIDFLIVTIGIPLAMILFAYAGWLYMSAGGDTGKISKGHDIFKSVIIGLALALAAWLIVHTIVFALKSSEFPLQFLFI